MFVHQVCRPSTSWSQTPGILFTFAKKEATFITILNSDPTFSIDYRMWPACLYQSHEVKETVALAMGWGTTSFAGSTSNELLQGNLTIVKSSDCNNQYEDDTDDLPQGIISSQICAGDETRKRDTCQGDSGQIRID